MVKHKVALEESYPQSKEENRRRKRQRDNRRLRKTSDRLPENEVLRQMTNLSLGLNEQQQKPTDDNKICEQYEIDRQFGRIRDKTNDTLDLLIKSCDLLQQKVNKQKQQVENELQQYYGQNSHRMDETN